MSEPVFCPNCLMQYKLSKITTRTKKLWHKADQYCSVCKQSYPLNATLISENTVRYMVQAEGEECKHLLEELEKLR